MNAVDLFAGPGGWDEGIRDLGIRPLGIEYDAAACATRAAAGHRTLQANVAALDPLNSGPCDLLIASPPCQAFSAAGKREGHEDVPLILDVARGLARGVDDRAEAKGSCVDPRSLLVLEPLRWALALRPEYIALEQVPPVLELWQVFADLLRWRGYNVWAGILSAEQYGVPQTRKRALLLASTSGHVAPPAPTHQVYEPGEPAAEQWTLEGVLHPWVSMADALGWTGRIGFPRLADDGAATEDGYGERDFRSSDEPAFNLTEKARSWTIRPDRVEERQEHGTSRNWGGGGPTPHERPATTVAGDPRLSSPTHHNHGEQNAHAIRVTLEEAATLQGFPADYPFQGTRTKQFEQVGNAVPPPLARAVILALVGHALEQQQAA